MQANRLRSFLTMSMVGMGIFCLVGVASVMEGVRSNVSSTFEQQGSHQLQIVSKVRKSAFRKRGRKQRGVPLLRYREMQAFARQYPARYGEVSMEVDGGSVRLSLPDQYKDTEGEFTLSGSDEKMLMSRDMALSVGRNFTTHEVRAIQHVSLIGEHVAQKVLGMDTHPIGKTIVAGSRRLKVIGVLKAKHESDATQNLVVVPHGLARSLSQKPRFSAHVSVSTEVDFDEAHAEAVRIMRLIRGDRPREENSFEMERSDFLIDQFNRVFAYVALGAGSISFLTLLGACVGLTNIMLVYVKERTQEIGLRKAIGSTPNRIQLQFLTEAIVTCQLGGTMGIVLGAGVALFVAKLMQITFFFPWVSVLLGLSVSTLVGLLSGYLPARQAAVVDPVESLRYE